jgi:hypothetical protein
MTKRGGKMTKRTHSSSDQGQDIRSKAPRLQVDTNFSPNNDDDTQEVLGSPAHAQSGSEDINQEDIQERKDEENRSAQDEGVEFSQRKQSFSNGMNDTINHAQLGTSTTSTFQSPPFKEDNNDEWDQDASPNQRSQSSLKFSVVALGEEKTDNQGPDCDPPAKSFAHTNEAGGQDRDMAVDLSLNEAGNAHSSIEFDDESSLAPNRGDSALLQPPYPGDPPFVRRLSWGEISTAQSRALHGHKLHEWNFNNVEEPHAGGQGDSPRSTSSSTDNTGDNNQYIYTNLILTGVTKVGAEALKRLAESIRKLGIVYACKVFLGKDFAEDVREIVRSSMHPHWRISVDVAAEIASRSVLKKWAEHYGPNIETLLRGD